MREILDESWSDWFAGLTLSPEADGTLLTGPCPDQAALYGVLMRLRDLGLHLVAVRRVNPPG